VTDSKKCMIDYSKSGIRSVKRPLRNACFESAARKEKKKTTAKNTLYDHHPSSRIVGAAETTLGVGEGASL